MYLLICAFIYIFILWLVFFVVINFIFQKTISTHTGLNLTAVVYN